MIWAAAVWLLLMGVIVACLVVAVATDLERRIIPNCLALLVLSCSLGLRLLPGPGPLWVSLLSSLAVLGGLGLLAAYDLIGWGDAKLITAVTFAVPPHRVVPLLLSITVAGGLMSCLYLAARLVLRQVMPTLNYANSGDDPAWSLRWLVQREGTRILANEPMPYALAVLGGTLYSLAME